MFVRLTLMAFVAFEVRTYKNSAKMEIMATFALGGK